MERAHLIRLKCADDGVQHATVMEQDEVLFPPVVRVYQLSAAARGRHHQGREGNEANTHTRCDSRSLHLV